MYDVHNMLLTLSQILSSRRRNLSFGLKIKIIVEVGVEAYTKKCQQTPFTTCENGSENISSILERLAFSSQNSTILYHPNFSNNLCTYFQNRPIESISTIYIFSNIIIDYSYKIVDAYIVL